MNIARGFTLIEAVIYLALFSILIDGGVIAAFNLFESAAYDGTYTLLSEESDFMLGKMRWALERSYAVASPAFGTVGSMLTVIEHDGTTIEFTRMGNDLSMRVNAGPRKPFNAPDVTVSDLEFLHLKATAKQPESLETVLTISARTSNGIRITLIATSTVYIEP